MRGYFVIKLPPVYKEMTLEELLYGDGKLTIVNENETNTRTYTYFVGGPQANRLLWKYGLGVESLTRKLEQFNSDTMELRARDRHDLYHTFHIPKKSGGLRKIDAPNDELMSALRELKDIFEKDFKVLYHTSAFAYVKKRSTLDALKRHQSNKSRWFAKFDLSNFFGSTTLDFIMKMLSVIFPFSEVVRSERGKNALREAIELAILDGGLPQGTPISPLITNVMMIPIDFALANKLRDFDGQKFVYTRYADDFLVSSRYDFDFRKIEEEIISVLEDFEAPFAIKKQKTRYGSSSGSNWNLGMMLNRNNEITVGHKKKRRFQAMLHSFVMDTRNGRPWPVEEVQAMEGYRNYYKMIEGDTIDRIVQHVGSKLNADIVGMIKEALRS